MMIPNKIIGQNYWAIGRYLDTSVVGEKIVPICQKVKCCTIGVLHNVVVYR